MNDLISRADLLDYLQMIPIDLGYREIEDITEFVKRMPSAEPEIIRCKDCMYYHPSYCEIWSKFGTVQTAENDYCSKAERRTDE